MTPNRFRTLVFAHYEKQGRHDLPWRKTKDSYKILVSEVMLQQTQVERVIGFYKAFLDSFPTIEVLANAPLSSVLLHWQGLGYNRRAKMLHEAAKAVVREHRGKMPASVEMLETLPGVGHYTARAVAAFAGNKDVVFVETNLRTAVIHHFFPNEEQVDDKVILSILEKALPKGGSRRWYSALMDYGSFLKRSGVRVNAKSKGYAKQSVFSGSGREARGAVLKALAKGPQTEAYLLGILGDDRREQLAVKLAQLLSENMIEKKRTKYQLKS